MQADFQQVWTVIQDATLSAAKKRERVEAFVSGRLDDATLARAALGRLAERFTASQLEQFHREYSRYVTSRLVARFARHPDHPVEVEAASYDAERRLVRLHARGSATMAGIPGSRRLMPRERIRLELWLRERAGEWRIVAIRMNDVDVSANFREQFESVLSRSEPAALIAELHERNERNAETNPFDS